MNIHIYLLPYDSGHRNERMGAGPEHLINHGLEDLLRRGGHTLQQTVIEASDAFLAEIKTSFDLYRQLAGHILESAARGEFPLVLSGNCGAALGGIYGLSGLSREALGVTWLDAHGDFNTPDTSTSGFLDGMGLATAAGLGWKSLAKTLPGFRPVRAGHILHLGGRDIDPGEEQLFTDHSVARIYAPEMRDKGVRTSLTPVLDRIDSQLKDIYLHLDVDVLDPVETPANQFITPDGLYVDDVLEVIDMLRGRFTLRGMGVGSYDPRYDEKGKTLTAVYQLIAAAVA